ncbi:MAG TPA: hypothetical protein VFQ91_11375 [Bryobacteraceae bacterium]|nr:hypothetical protein [Bryobacteraceae bacterium]
MFWQGTFDAIAGRVAGALLTILLLAASHVPPSLLFFQALASNTSCTAHCCRAQRKCCCRKLPPAPHGPAFHSSSSCPSGCNRVILSAPQPHWLAYLPAMDFLRLASGFGVLSIAGTMHYRRRETWLRLLQRPPPNPAY